MHGQPADTGNYVEHRAYRRRDQADRPIEHKHQAEIHGVDAGLDRNRQHHRREDQNGRRQIKRRADDDQHNHHDRHQQLGTVDQRAEPAGKRAGQVGQRDHVAGHLGAGAQKHDNGRRFARPHQHAVDFGNFHFAVHEQCDEQRIKRGNDGGFGRCEDACFHATDDDDRHEQRPERLDGSAQTLFHWQRFSFRQVDFAQDNFPGNDQADAHDQARHDARDEQCRNRGVGRHAVDHKRHRRRNDRRDDAARGDQAGRGVHRVALLAHHRQQNCR